jgi:hypothetical protein
MAGENPRVDLEAGPFIVGADAAMDLPSDVPDQQGQWYMLCELVRIGKRYILDVQRANERVDDLMEAKDRLLEAEKRLGGLTERIEAAADRVVAAFGVSSGRTPE